MLIFMRLFLLDFYDSLFSVLFQEIERKERQISQEKSFFSFYSSPNSLKGKEK